MVIVFVLPLFTQHFQFLFSAIIHCLILLTLPVDEGSWCGPINILIYVTCPIFLLFCLKLLTLLLPCLAGLRLSCLLPFVGSSELAKILIGVIVQLKGLGSLIGELSLVGGRLILPFPETSGPCISISLGSLGTKVILYYLQLYFLAN